MAPTRVAATVALLAATVHGFSVTPFPASVLRSPSARHHAGHIQRARELVTQKGWTEEVDQGSGQTYFYNDETGETSWEPPPGLQAGGGGGGALPAGWAALVDEGSGQTYYLNEQTGESSWDPPGQAGASGLPGSSDQPIWRLVPYNGV